MIGGVTGGGRGEVEGDDGVSCPSIESVNPILIYIIYIIIFNIISSNIEDI